MKLRFAIVAIVVSFIAGSSVVQAADFTRLFGTWFATGEPDAAACTGLSYVFTPTTQSIRLGSSGPYGAPLPVSYVDGGGQRIGVNGNTGYPLIFNLLDDNHIQLDGLPSCILTRHR